MSHYASLLIFSLSVTITFSLLNRDSSRERFQYFLTLFGYMAVGSLLFAWIMYFIPW